MSDKTAIPVQAQLVVIGAGPGGYAAAFKAAELGLQVTVIDPEANPGGVCLHRGCIPSKALLHVAKVIGEAEESAEIGVTFGKPKIDVDKVRAWKDEVVGKLTGGLGMKVEHKKLTYVRGMARFKDATTLLVTAADGTEGEMKFEQAILATGSRPIMLPGVDADSELIFDSTGALELVDVPATLLVVGGGYIGLELGSAYQAMGSKVSVVEMTNGLLPGCDRDLVSVLKRRLDVKFDSIMLNTKVAGLKETKSGVQVTLEDKKGDQTQQNFAKVLVAIGRRPNTENLGLEDAGVSLDEKGFREGGRTAANRRMRTSSPSATSPENPCSPTRPTPKRPWPPKRSPDARPFTIPRAIPAVVFTDPEIAWCGTHRNRSPRRQAQGQDGQAALARRRAHLDPGP